MTIAQKHRTPINRWTTVLTSVVAWVVGTSASANLQFASSFGISGRNASYDYVVVGGGTAGLALAMRLAENTSHSVAVVEAGGFYQVDRGNTSVVPRLGEAYDAINIAPASLAPSVDWGFLTAPQIAVDDRVLHYWRGKTLGGSSAINNAVYQRATRDSYKLWAQMVADESYTFEALLPYFKKGVDFTPANARLRPANATVPPVSNGSFSPSSGPLKVSYTNYAISFDTWAAMAFNEMALPEIEDFVSGTLIGHQYTPHELDPSDETRSSSQTSYLNEALFSERTNLQVYPHTLAKRILFADDKAATGVQVTTSGATYSLSATREVILSAGAFQSPQLLMVSGIGPATALDALSIPVMADRPGVGQNMWDHVEFGPVYPVDVGRVDEYSLPSLIPAASEEYRINKTGVMAGFGFDYIGWSKLPGQYRSGLSREAQAELADFPDDWPEIEFVIAETPGNVSGNFALINTALVAPLSRGSVTINSTDTSDPPVIDPNWLSSPTDQQLAIQAFKVARAMFNSTAVRRILRGPELLPGPSVQSDEDILAFIKQHLGTLYHASCTCAMGVASDAMAVVDSAARVIGVSGLRVVDASIFPILPPGHPTSIIYALAEKIADDINHGR